MYNTKSSNNASKGENKTQSKKRDNKITMNENALNNYNTTNNNVNTNFNSYNITSNLHKDCNTLSPLNSDCPAGIIYSPNCENFQKRKNA